MAVHIGSYGNILILPHTLVWHVTHNAGGDLLPSRLRSFISFSFGGVNIESFNLIACCEGDTISRNGYADFEDLVTSYDIMDGLYYHGTHFKPNTLSLKLASDAIDLKELDSFLHWFKGGVTRELILAEHPNRAIMARVATPPHIDLTPFEKRIMVNIGNTLHETSTTVYRGFIDLELVADLPFWYAKLNVLFLDDVNSINTYSGIDIFTNEDVLREALKVVYEDTVPTINMVLHTMHFGVEKYAALSDNVAYTLIAGPINSNDPTTLPSDWDENRLGYFMHGNEYWRGARIELDDVIIGRIAGPYVGEEGTNISANISRGNDKSLFLFFYGGNAPSPVRLRFTLDLTPRQSNISYIGDNNIRYIDCIAHEHYKVEGNPYNIIKIGSVHEKEFRFTTPNIITSYNKVIRMMVVDIVKHKRYTNREDILDALKDEIRHPAVRKWAVDLFLYVYDYKKSDSTYFSGEDVVITTHDNAPNTSTCINYYLNLLPRFFQQTSGNWSVAEFDFDSEMGTATGTFSYWICASNKNLAYAVLNNQTVESTDKLFITKSEDVGDMLCSNWLILEDHNEFTPEGHVSAWSKSSPRNAHYLIHNCLAPLTEVQVSYKNMYL